MSEIDLDRLGDVWRAPPDPAEIEQLRRGAEAVRRRARWGQLVDYGLAVLVSGVVLILMVSNPSTATGLLGGAAILLMLHSTVRQRQLRRIEVQELSGPTEEMLNQSIARVEAALKRNKLALFGYLPSLLAGVLFAASIERTGRTFQIPDIPGVPFLRPAVLIIGVAIIIGAPIFFLRQRQKKMAERERLVLLQEAYRQEK
jgi:hypothetical protein